MDFKIGQYVYTAIETRGWWDRSLSSVIPINTRGQIVNIRSFGKVTLCSVEFTEFGIVNFKADDLTKDIK